MNWKTVKTELRYLFLPEGDARRVGAFLGLVTVAAAILRALLVNQPVFYDEAYTFIFYASKPLPTILANYSAPNNHIFHTLLAALVYRLFGASPLLLRLPAFLAGIACVPAAYLAARRFFNANQALAAAAAIAVTPGLVEYSANGRGYTLIVLFSLLLANFAGLLVREQRRSALAAYGLTAALGFFTIPIFLYPMAGLSLWLAASYLTESGARQSGFRSLKVFLFTCALAGILTFLFYSPVIFFGTGLGSLIGNEIVEPQTWRTFRANLAPRLTNTLIFWMSGIAPTFRVLSVVGFALSLLFQKKVSNQRLSLPVCMTLAIAVSMLVQRVVPLPRVWLFLEAFYMLFAAAGLTWLIELVLNRFPMRFNSAVIPSAIILVTAGILVSTVTSARTATVQKRDSPEEMAAAYILAHIQPEDTLVAVSPVDIQTAYYLVVNGLSYDRFYQPSRPAKIQNALVLARTNSSDSTYRSVLKYYDLSSSFILRRAKLVYEYGPLQIYSIPAKAKK